MPTGDGRVDEVPRQHQEVLGQHRHHDGGIFASLALVDRNGVGQQQLVEVALFVGTLRSKYCTVSVRLCLVDRGDESDVAVIDVLVVVVPSLHQLVPNRSVRAARDEPPAAGLSACWSRVLSAAEPAPPRRMGERTWTSVLGLSPKRAGMRFVTSSRMESAALSAVFRSRTKNSPGGPTALSGGIRRGYGARS